MKRTIDKSLAAFKLKDLEVFVNIVETLSMDGNSVKTAVEYIKDSANRIVSDLPTVDVCPMCGKAELITYIIERKSENNWSRVRRCSSSIGCKKNDRNDERDSNDFCTYEEFMK